MSVTVKNNGGEMIIDLKPLKDFAEIKKELDRRLGFSDGFLIGTQVTVDIGEINLNKEQIGEIEEILLSYGLHLKGLMSNGPPSDTKESDGNTHFLGHIPYYQETVLICRHLRSGQKFFGEGNVVILGDVNPGAEIVAGGNILVMGALKGMAHAGVFGDETAVISAYRLNPTQLRIANHITRPPDGEEIVVDCPEVARIRAGKVIIEKLKI